MVVRNVVRSPVRAVVQSVFGEGESFHPFQLFRSGAQGAWYDPSDYSTLYQNAAGTTPVTAVEQPVRLMLDRSRGLVLGSELVSNPGNPFVNTTGYTSQRGATLSVVSGALRVLGGGVTTFPYASVPITTIANRFYQFTITAVAGAAAYVDIADAAVGGSVLASTSALPGVRTHTLTFRAPGTSLFVALVSGASSSASADWSSVSVRELPGNHALAPNDASRPVLRARYNLLTRTEEFDNAAWTKLAILAFGSGSVANAAVAPDGTTTADLIVADTTSSSLHGVTQNVAAIANARYTHSIYAKAAGYDFLYMTEGNNVTAQASFNLATGALGTVTGTGSPVATITPVGNGWYRCTLSLTPISTSQNLQARAANADGGPTFTGDGTSGILIWGAQLLTAADHAATGGAYQRVGAATDYDTGPPWRPYLAVDGVDDWMVPASALNLGETWSHVGGWLATLDSRLFGTSSNEKGSARANTGLSQVQWQNSGSTWAQIAGGTLTNTNVITIEQAGTSSISGRLNAAAGSAITPFDDSVDTQGLVLFSRQNSSWSAGLAGRFYGGLWIARAFAGTERANLESWVAGKTGVSL